MPEIHAFRGIRYDLGHVGALSDVIAPPYDVISPALQDALYKKHAANVIRLILNRDEPGDDEYTNRYSRAAKFLNAWQSQGVLFKESQESIYVYHQAFDYQGRTYTRKGFMARVRLERFGQGRIYPHEETMSGPKQDRLLLTRACRVNLSQIFGLYPDASGQIMQQVDAATQGITALEASDHLGVVHRMWPISNQECIQYVIQKMAGLPVFIADGHHRYETACNYRDELQASAKLDTMHPANFVLMMLIGMEDPGLIVMPTHRLFRGLPGLTSTDLRNKLAPYFEVQDGGTGPERASSIWQHIESADNQGTLGLYTAADSRWTIATINDRGRQHLATIASNHSADWRELGVSILHSLAIETALGGKDLPTPKYVHLVEEVEEGVKSGEFPLAALVMPATVQHIEMISGHGERMPAKSTYFYPKLLSGLVINPLS